MYHSSKYCGKFFAISWLAAGCLFKISKKGNNTHPGTHLTLPRHAISHLASPCITLASLCITSHLAICLASPYIPSCRTLHLTSPHLASPQNPSLAPQHKLNFILLHVTFCITTRLITFHLAICLASRLVLPYASPHVSPHILLHISPHHTSHDTSPRHASPSYPGSQAPV